MEHRPFIDIIKEHMESETLRLPMFHPIALKLQELLHDQNFSTEQVTALIIRDQALTSQVLRMANSAFFSGLSKVATMKEAVVRLGAKQIASLAMLASQESNYNFATPELKYFSQRLWKHAMGCALGSKWLAERTGFKALSQEAFIGGLLHDIGQLLILKVMEKVIQEEKSTLKISKELTIEIMRSMHCESGYDLLRRWNLPDIYCQIVRNHHQEATDKNNELLCVVQLADKTCNKIGLGINTDPTIMLAATFEAQILGAKEILLAELEIMIEDAMGVTSRSS
jgi:HD-like signal output (HDOD) protein